MSKERPWLDEPDRLEFEAHGFKCLIKRNNLRPQRNPKDWLGHLCGYVAIPSTHPYYEKKEGWNEDNGIGNLDVHGGVTFTGVLEREKDGIWYIGFDCAHGGDLIPGIYEMRQPGECLHRPNENYDLSRFEVYRDIEFVKQQCIELAEQLRAVA